MTVEEMIKELGERLLIEIADGTLPEEDQRVVLNLLEEINKEEAEHGHVKINLTSEQLAMEWAFRLSGHIWTPPW